MLGDRFRYPQVGDIVVQKSHEEEYVGCVYEIVSDKYGHEKIFIAWAESPPDYVPEYGYSAANIHNLRRTFDVIKTS